MPNDFPRDRQHLFAPLGGAENFTAHIRGGSDSSFPERNREQHARALEQQLGIAVQQRQVLVAEDPQAAAGGGFYLEFKLNKDAAESALSSLENRLGKNPIELRSVRDDGQFVSAVVFVPDSRSEHFAQRVEEFRTENTKPSKKTNKTNPKHQTLITAIESAALVSQVRAMFTDPVPFPPLDQLIWWEAWLEQDTVLEFRAKASAQGLLVTDGQFQFLERDVVLVHATAVALGMLINTFGGFAELRLAKETAFTFLQLGPQDQRNFSDDLLQRTTVDNPNGVYVCILDTGIARLHPLIQPHLEPQHSHSLDATPGDIDQFGHGTRMAGLVVYGDLTPALGGNVPLRVHHGLESSKIFPNGSAQDRRYAQLTRDGVANAEQANPNGTRVICLAISEQYPSDLVAADASLNDMGEPSLWSAAVDQLAFEIDPDGGPVTYRLMVVAAGNTPRPRVRGDYPAQNDLYGIQSPGQAWNAITVGAYTEKTTISDASFAGHGPLAQAGELSPTSRTSIIWGTGKVLKPDLVLEGGNFSVAGDDTVDSPDDLALLTTRHDFVLGGRLFNHFADTSAATALAAGMVARIRHEYPTLWPETIRALLVHSASWTPAMLAALDKNPKKRDLENLLLRRYGFGVPNLERAMYSAKNHLTLIFEDDLQPFYKSGSDIKTFQMKTHLLGWKGVLESLGEAQVSLKVTLSYFIEPNPGRRGNIPRFGYASHDLRFEVKRPEESLATFKHRINKSGSTINAQNKPDLSEDNIGWFLGSTFRKRGSLLSDTWTGNAAELASRDAIVVYPASGWWKERKSHGRYDHKARYALVVSLQVETDVDIYAQIATAIAVANKATVQTQVLVEIDVPTQ